MSGLLEYLDALQVLAFVGAGAAASWQWFRQRTRPAAYLAAAFSLAGGVMILSRLLGDVESPWLTALLLGALAAFPWLLAAFAWSFAGPLPRWLRLVGVTAPVLGVWAAALPPLLTEGEAWTLGQALFVTVFLGWWTVLAVLMAARLWRAGSRQRLVRARMRLMATAAVLVTLALIMGAVSGPDADALVDAGASGLAVLAVALFVAGFAPPLPLRLWWRRRSSRLYQQMQVALIGTADPEGVAEAVVEVLADLVGGGVAVLDQDGRVLGAAQLGDDELRELAARLLAGGSLPEHASAHPVGDAWLLVRSTPYTPVFGQDELELVGAFSLHLRIALERAQLYRAEQAARQEAQEVRRELESTLYGLSHDLKSPTVAISGFVELLPDATGDERDEMLAHIRSSADYLHRLVEDMLELSRIGRTQTEVAEVDLAEVVRQIGGRVRVSHPGAVLRIEGALPTARLNPARAEQLFDNLVGNAVRHGGREDITVTVSAHHRDGWLELHVADDGRGIPAEERERVFELFQRGSTSGGRGSGVGLSMVRRIAEAYRGEVDLADDDVGTRIVVRLPQEVAATPSPASTRSA